MQVLNTGTVVNITIMDLNGWTQGYFFLQDAVTNQIEVFILWAVPDGTTEWAPKWIERGLSVSLLRQALVSGTQVGVWHDDTSSVADTVEMGSYLV